MIALAKRVKFYQFSDSELAATETAALGPSRYFLRIIHNAKVPFHFIIWLLQHYLNKPYIEACFLNDMLKINKYIDIGFYTKDVIETILMKVEQSAKEFDYPLKCLIKKEDSCVIEES